MNAPDEAIVTNPTTTATKCESDFLAQLKPPQTRVYQQEMQACDDRHRNQAGTMSLSFNAFCRARVAQHYSQQALKAAGSKPLR